MANEPPTDDRVLFCPFCRECYEGKALCPEHELPLVEFDALPKQAHERQVPGWGERVAPWDPRFGRAWIALGVLAAVAGFFLPIVIGSYDDQPLSWSAYVVAVTRAPNLWTVPFVAAMFVVFLYRRRTPMEMRGSRLVGLLLALMPAASLAYSLRNVQRAVAEMQGAVSIEWGPGVYAIGAASALLAVGSLRFGAMPGGDGAPHGAEPDEGAPRIERDEPAPRARRRKRR